MRHKQNLQQNLDYITTQTLESRPGFPLYFFPLKVLTIKFATCLEGRISASRRRSLNIKGSAESPLKNDLLTVFSLLYCK